MKRKRISLFLVDKIGSKFCFKTFAFSFILTILPETFVDLSSLFFKKEALSIKCSIPPEALIDVAVCFDKSSFTLENTVLA